MRILVLIKLFLVAGIAAAANLDDIVLPPGFTIDVLAEVPNARSLVLGERGTIFVSNRRERSVYAVVLREGEEPEVVEILAGLNTPNGIAFHDGDLYVAEVARVFRYRDIENRLGDPPDAELLPIDLPGKRHHGWRYIAFGPDGKLYISIGAPCNVCDEDGFAEIIRVDPDGGNRETYARGIRNSVGFTWHPETSELWFTDNGRDMLGDNLPPCELNRVTTVGQHFGFPYCHGGNLLDPKFGEGRDCADYEPPVQNLGPHVAPLGVRFYTGAMFPEDYRGQIFIAEHGSWNRSEKIGYRVMLVRLEDGLPVSYEPFAEGWLQGQDVSGRPVDLLVLEDGSMIVSDDNAGLLYRISYDMPIAGITGD